MLTGVPSLLEALARTTVFPGPRNHFLPHLSLCQSKALTHTHNSTPLFQTTNPQIRIQTTLPLSMLLPRISWPPTCKNFAFPLWTMYDAVASPHPPHLPMPEIQPLLIMLLPILLAPVLLLLLPVPLSSVHALSLRLWGAHSRVWCWSWDQTTARRCPTQVLWIRSNQSSHVTRPTSRSLSSRTIAGSIKPWPAHSHEPHVLWWPFQRLNPPSWTRSNSTKNIEKPSSFAVSDAIDFSTETPPSVDTLVAVLQQTNLPATGLLHNSLGKEPAWKGYSWIYQFKMCFYILACRTSLVLMNTSSCTILCCNHHAQTILR